MILRSPWKSAMLFYGNYFFTAVFALESVVKIFAMSPRYFFAVIISYQRVRRQALRNYFRKPGTILTLWLWYFQWLSSWRSSLGSQCFDLCVFWEFSSSPRIGSPWTTSWPSWEVWSEAFQTSPSSWASSSSSLPWWACSCTGTTIERSNACFPNVKCQDGTSRTSSTASWLSFESSAGNGLVKYL